MSTTTTKQNAAKVSASHYDATGEVANHYFGDYRQWTINLTGNGWWWTISSHEGDIVSDGCEVRYLAHVYVHDGEMSEFRGHDTLGEAMAFVANVLRSYGY